MKLFPNFLLLKDLERRKEELEMPKSVNVHKIITCVHTKGDDTKMFLHSKTEINHMTSLLIYFKICY